MIGLQGTSSAQSARQPAGASSAQSARQPGGASSAQSVIPPVYAMPQSVAVSYTHLTLPTIYSVKISVVAVALIKKKK